LHEQIVFDAENVVGLARKFDRLRFLLQRRDGAGQRHHPVVRVDADLLTAHIGVGEQTRPHVVRDCGIADGTADSSRRREPGYTLEPRRPPCVNCLRAGLVLNV